MAAYSGYLLVVTVFALLTARSVFLSVRRMTPSAQGPAPVQLPARSCVERIEASWRSLDAERKKISDSQPAAQAAQAWSEFRIGWLTRLRQDQAQCAQAATPSMHRAFRQLEQVQDLYTTHVVQYAGEVGGAVDRFRDDLAQTRSELPPAVGSP